MYFKLVDHTNMNEPSFWRMYDDVYRFDCNLVPYEEAQRVMKERMENYLPESEHFFLEGYNDPDCVKKFAYKILCYKNVHDGSYNFTIYMLKNNGYDLFVLNDNGKTIEHIY
jgi:hypothetical protein